MDSVSPNTRRQDALMLSKTKSVMELEVASLKDAMLVAEQVPFAQLSF